MDRISRNVRVALYARVSSEQQAEANTIASQLAELKQRIAHDGYTLDADACFVDDGVSGTTLLRPALERLRDQVAQGAVDRLYVLAPDRLARKAAYQALLVDEFTQAGVELAFLNHALGKSPEDDLLLQMQGIIAEYERTKIMERSRRGKLHAARQGSVNVLAVAPFGYRYVTVQEGGGQARYEVMLEEARVVQQIFAWVGRERLSIQEVCRRLEKTKVKTRTGLSRWQAATVAYMLKNPAYHGQAGYGKSHIEPRRPSLRPPRGKPEQPRRPFSVTRCNTQATPIPVPALVDAELFAAANEQFVENRQRYRQSRRGASFLLQGLLVCPTCGYAWCGQPRYKRKDQKTDRPCGYYRCSGRMAAKHDATKPTCRNKPIASGTLDETVWRDVCQLLRQPHKIEAEFERRLRRQDKASPARHSLSARIAQLKRGIARLIDAYSEGLLEKGEFEPKIRQSKERLARLETEEKALADDEAKRGELRLLIGQLEEFTQRMDRGLEEADWSTRREIIRALVKQIEVSDTQVRIVYRVNTIPFVKAPNGGVSQDCYKRADTFSKVPVWKTNRPFDEQHYAWEKSDSQVSADADSDRQLSAGAASDRPSAAPVSTNREASATIVAVPVDAATADSNEKAAGHKRDKPAQTKVVTAADSSVESAAAVVNTPAPGVATLPAQAPSSAPRADAPPRARPQVDFAFVRQQITMEQVLRHLGFFDSLRGRSQQRRGPCPVHVQVTERKRTFSVHLSKHICQCFQADCAIQGNVLDLWAAIQRLPLYEAALHLAETFHLHRNREEERVKGTR